MRCIEPWVGPSVLGSGLFVGCSTRPAPARLPTNVAAETAQGSTSAAAVGRLPAPDLRLATSVLNMELNAAGSIRNIDDRPPKLLRHNH